ncbi:hypothetical protein [Leuconostoc mesenteroides]|uniref:hypothetical protein n=1 Tax=Leuconostoc mesenteroides TaxID=1245 RepID=UPI001CBC0BFD|nr:hypothetical protein [Leuconostoc mesenteroides]MBZ1508885.1 hypothetical protein [Leuconostoc mesenteroides]MBZ1532803.1 hypothetical protein [Leuconostoc mesenteroides]
MKVSELVESNDLSALERVWKRQDEAKKMFIDHETFAEVERLDVKTLRKIAKQEGTTLEKFLVYAQKRSEVDE